jgi:hypothetical protein
MKTIISITLSTYKVGTYTMHKATETLETVDSSTETGIVGIGRTESEAFENYEYNKAQGFNCHENLAFA